MLCSSVKGWWPPILSRIEEACWTRKNSRWKCPIQDRLGQRNDENFFILGQVPKPDPQHSLLEIFPSFAGLPDLLRENIQQYICCYLSDLHVLSPGGSKGGDKYFDSLIISFSIITKCNLSSAYHCWPLLLTASRPLARRMHPSFFWPWFQSNEVIAQDRPVLLRQVHELNP